MLIVVAGVMLVGCGRLTPTPAPTDLPGGLPPGAPGQVTDIDGQTWTPCTDEQLAKYPPVLDLPSQTYYSGPWCAGAPGNYRYMWVYSHPLSNGESPQQVRGYVRQDGRLLVRNLRTTGYEHIVMRVDEGQDVVYLGRRPGSPNVVGVLMTGDEVPPAGRTYTGEDPLRLYVTVRRSGPAVTARASPSP